MQIAEELLGQRVTGLSMLFHIGSYRTGLPFGFGSR